MVGGEVGGGAARTVRAVVGAGVGRARCGRRGRGRRRGRPVGAGVGSRRRRLAGCGRRTAPGRVARRRGGAGWWRWQREAAPGRRGRRLPVSGPRPAWPGRPASPPGGPQRPAGHAGGGQLVLPRQRGLHRGLLRLLLRRLDLGDQDGQLALDLSEGLPGGRPGPRRPRLRSLRSSTRVATAWRWRRRAASTARVWRASTAR